MVSFLTLALLVQDIRLNKFRPQVYNLFIIGKYKKKIKKKKDMLINKIKIMDIEYNYFRKIGIRCNFLN